MQKYQKWVNEFYSERGWHRFSPFIRVNFLMEELGDVLDNILILADH